MEILGACAFLFGLFSCALLFAAIVAEGMH